MKKWPSSAVSSCVRFTRPRARVRPVGVAGHPEQHEALCRGLAATLGGDTKYSDNDLLRPPGTWNYKSAVDGGDPTPVTALVVATTAGSTRATLAGLIGVDLANPAATNGVPAPAGPH